MNALPHGLALPLLAALVPAAQAELQEVGTPWYPESVEACRTTAENAQAAEAKLDAALQELGGTAQADSRTTSGAPAPGEQEGDSVATCDSGLFFDVSHPNVVQLVYLDNVHLTDSRLQLDARHRLYLQIQQEKDKKEQAGGQGTGGTSSPAAEEAPEPAAEGETAPPTPSSAPGQEAEEKDEAPLPLIVSAYDAMVDMHGNRMLFTGGPGVDVLRFTQGDNLLEIRSTADQVAQVLADEAGNVLMEGPVISMRWKDREGQAGWLEAKGGRALYHGESHSLVLEGPVTLEQEPGSRIETDGRLAVSFRMAEGAAPAPKEEFMAQFTALRFEGVAAASTERGQRVLLADKARAMSALGTALRYNGSTGEVEMEGTPCVLGYEANEVRTDGTLDLAEDGSITLRGELIEGRYERPSQHAEGQSVSGTLSAAEEICFHADSGTVTTYALRARDAEADFSCTGEVEFTLRPLPEEKRRNQPPREKMGMLNLAIANYGEVSAVRASGNVRAHGYTPGGESTPDSSLTGSELDANLLTGEMLLIGAGEPAGLAYQGYTLASSAQGGGQARVQLLPNGDIEAQGARIDAALPGSRGRTTMSCTGNATLRRESRQLALGPGSRIAAQEGIITANGPLVAVLAASDKPARPASERYPHLVYNFSGLESASTQKGATIRTEKGSLQCTGEFSITMDDASRSRSNKLGGIRSGLAVGQVAIAGLDGTGRLVRAKGDRLTVNGRTGEKILTGSTVVLEDEYNRHKASGGNARVRLDERNNAVITGARHETTAQSIHKQVDERKNQPKKKR